MPRLVFLSCSQKKRENSNSLPAIELYDGTAFRVLRRYLKTETNDLNVYIMSAKHGLIECTTQIQFYDQKLEISEVENLKKLVSRQMEENSIEHNQKQVFVNLGKLYHQAFKPILNFLPSETELTFAQGSSGKRLAMMHDWLYGPKSSLRTHEPTEKITGTAKLRSVEIALSREQIFSIAREKLNAEAANFQSWYVRIDDKQISPKWLVSQITNLPVSTFHSDQARKILHKLGIKVERV